MVIMLDSTNTKLWERLRYANLYQGQRVTLFDSCPNKNKMGIATRVGSLSVADVADFFALAKHLVLIVIFSVTLLVI